MLLIAAVLISGFDLSNSMNSGSFWNGMGQFFDYPAGLLAETWAKIGDFPGLLWRFLDHGL